MKERMKQLANGIALCIALIPWLLYRLEALLIGDSKAFPGWSQFFSLLPGISGGYLRRAFYRLSFVDCASDCWISFGTVFSHSTVRIGKNAYIGSFCSIGDVTIEDDVLIASHVSIANGPAQHGIDRLDIPIREQPGAWSRVTIGRDTWIGERAAVLVDVGKHCVIGCGAVVSRNIPDYAIAVGVPARVVSSRLPPGLSEALRSQAAAPPFTKTQA
jgi:virginiamycin A acetyltransferase